MIKIILNWLYKMFMKPKPNRRERRHEASLRRRGVYFGDER